MKQISLNRTKDYQIGNVRVDKKTLDKVEELAKKNKISNQVVVRALLENFIDEITFV